MIQRTYAPWVVVAVDFNAHEADNRGHTVAVNVEFVKGSIPVVVEVILHAGNQVVKHVPWNRICLLYTSDAADDP